MPLDLPHVPGLEAAGVVDEVGEGVVGVAVGDRVFGNGSATYAELAVLKAFAPIPGALTMAEAAALPVSVETGARLLDLLELHPGGAAGRRRRVRQASAPASSSSPSPAASPSSAPRPRRTTATCASSARSPPRTAQGLADRVHALVDQPVAGCARPRRQGRRTRPGGAHR